MAPDNNDMTAAFLAGLAAEQDEADRAASESAAAANDRHATAWAVGYQTWTIAGPPASSAPAPIPVAPVSAPTTGKT